MTILSDRSLNLDELGTLYAIARDLNSTLDVDEVLRKVMDRVIEVVGADRGFLMLLNQKTNELEFTIARNSQVQTLEQGEFEKLSLSTVMQVVKNRNMLADSDLDHPTSSMLSYGIRSLMCAPLVVRQACIGAVYIDRRTTSDLFDSKQRELLLAFCHQAAIAIDNARLFADLTEAMRKVNHDKQYRDNIFASLANGVITTNASGVITMFNVAAGHILNLNPQEALGKHYTSVFGARPQVGLIDVLHNTQVQHEHGTIVSSSVVCDIPGRRGLVYLNLSVSSVRDLGGTPIGMALVLDDRTEQKKREAEAREIRHIFQRYVHPSVVEQLLKNPQALHLGGETREVTVVFADIRGYTRMSEHLAPEAVMDLLNGYLKIMVEKIWEEGGTLTAFLGDALMAIFNAPLSQKNHALKAVRAAWKMRLAVLDYQHARPLELPVSFGFGITTGLAVVGNLGSEERMQNYTAIGDTVNVAARLQAHATNNTILLHDSTYLQVYRHVQTGEPFALTVKHKTAPLTVRSLLGLV